MKTINIFVPGRISIIGELSDLVTEYIAINDKIIPGEVIAGGIDKGIYATAKQNKNFVFKFGTKKFIAKNMDLKVLYDTAKSGTFFSYIAAVAHYMKINYNVEGISINVRFMNLPIQKGLSSSASICVLVTKAFNKIYNLQLTDNEIMEIAYESERFALSMCGKLDQICAKGLCLSHIIFNKENLTINNLDIKKELNFIIADLNGFKDTKKILSKIHTCFPFPKNEEEQLVKETLCEKNQYLVRESIDAIKNGKLKYLGELLNTAQKNIDNNIGKICKEIYGPILHKVMADNTIKKYSYGSKGTGSNGDGSIIILAKDKDSQKNIINYLEKEYKLSPFEYNVKKTYNIKKAMLNLTKTNYNNNNIISLLEALDDKEINKIYIIGKKTHFTQIERIFNKNYSDKDFALLSSEGKVHQIKLYRIFEKIVFIYDKQLTKTSLTDYCKDAPIIYIPEYTSNIKETITKTLDEYEEQNTIVKIDKVNTLYEIKQNTIISFQK